MNTRTHTKKKKKEGVGGGDGGGGGWGWGVGAGSEVISFFSFFLHDGEVELHVLGCRLTY